MLALIREKRRVYRSFVQTRDPALKTIFNRLNAQVRRDLNRFREEQWIDSCRLLDYRNGKKFWTQFQTLTGQKTTTVHHLVRNNAIINTPLEKANCFAETLEQIHQVPNDPHFDDAFFAQVIRSVNNFRRNHATTVMIPKPGKDPTNPFPYRPISLLNIAGKVFEKILSTRLKNFLESNNLLPPEQFGFRSERSTINPILEFHTDTTRHANLKEHTLAVFLDIERAFDRVWHDGVAQKLIKIPINPNFIQLIHSFLSNRTCSVKIQNIKSRPIALQAGVPQGSILSPLFYIVYCRDFPVRYRCPPNEDQTLRRRHRRVDKPEKPRDRRQDPTGHLNDITTWTNTWRIKPNPLKSQSILMSYSGAWSRHQASHLPPTSASPFPKIAPSTRTSKKPLKNPATEPTSCTGFEGASVGAIRKPCTTPTNPTSVPSSNTAPPSTPPYTRPSSTKSPPAREECSAGSFVSPTGSPPTTSTRKPTQSRSNPASKNSRAAT
jgi:hypothetical protein